MSIFGPSTRKKMKFGTKAVHAGVVPDPATGAIMTPIFQTSTYVQESPAKHKGYAYARGANPTRNALQTSLTALENGKFALCFSSGMGATDALISGSILEALERSMKWNLMPYF